MISVKSSSMSSAYSVHFFFTGTQSSSATKTESLSEFSLSYLDIAEILLGLLRASREGNWELHVSTIRKMIPWCFAYDKVDYARYLSSYPSEMSHLEEEHAELLAYFRAGGFSVQIRGRNPFGKIPEDQACEETVSKDTQTAEGHERVQPEAKSHQQILSHHRVPKHIHATTEGYAQPRHLNYFSNTLIFKELA